MLLKHFAIIAWRNIKRRKLLALIQVVCLSIGIAAFILVARYVQYEKDWDKFNENFARIYRAQTYKIGDRLNDFNQVPVPVARYFKSNYPEVDEAIVLREVWQEYLSTDKQKVYKEKSGYLAPSKVFDVFSFKLLRGDKATVLDQPNSMVLSQSMAKRYFPEGDPIGQVIFDSYKNELIVTGIMEDIPEQAEIQASYFKSNSKLLKDNGAIWTNSSYKVYVMLKQDVALANLDNKIANLINDHDPIAKRVLYLNPLRKLHLNENPRDDRGTLIYFFSFLGGLTLLLACVSFMNLATSFSSLRFVEIGLRKVVGCSNNYLKLQFLVEAVVMALISFIVAVFLAHLILPVFNEVVDRNIDLIIFSDFYFLSFILLVVVLTGLLAGVYPAFVVSSFNPVVVLKGKSAFKKGRITGLKAMVYVQFVLSVTLITTSLWIYKHVDFLINKDVGFNNKTLLNCDLPSNKSTVSYEALRHEILAHSGIEDMSLSLNSPMILNWGSLVFPEGGDHENPVFTRWNSACHHFVETMEMQLSEGRNFSKHLASDNQSCLINETAVKAFGWDNPLGKTMEMQEEEFKVVGVIKDFNIDDVHNPILPYVLLYRQANWAYGNDLNFSVREGQRQDALAHINGVLKNHFPDVLFAVNEYEANSNRQEIKIWSSAQKTFAFFSLMAILIASIGLFGLVFFATQRKVKEIGIRKAQGASVYQIVMLVTRQFVVLALASNILVFPIAFFLRDLSPGLYKYQFTLIDILLVLLISLLITIVSSAGQAIQASYQNPVKALRYE